MSTVSNFNDDSYTYEPEQHVEANAEVVPYPGHYLVKPLSVGRAKNKDGDEIVRKGEGDTTWPILRINRVQIENEDGTVQKFAVFQDVATKPFPRNGAGNRKVFVSQAQDVLKAIDIDETLNASGFEEVYTTAEQRLKAGDPFVAFVGLTARDSAWIKAKLAELGPNASWEEKNKIYNEGTKRTKDFRNPDGTYKFQVEGPSGAVLNARPTLTGYVSSAKRDSVTLGPQQASSK
jgi:hypothetical protein